MSLRGVPPPGAPSLTPLLPLRQHLVHRGGRPYRTTTKAPAAQTMRRLPSARLKQREHSPPRCDSAGAGDPADRAAARQLDGGIEPSSSREPSARSMRRRPDGRRAEVADDGLSRSEAGPAPFEGAVFVQHQASRRRSPRRRSARPAPRACPAAPGLADDRGEGHRWPARIWSSRSSPRRRRRHCPPGPSATRKRLPSTAQGGCDLPGVSERAARARSLRGVIRALTACRQAQHALDHVPFLPRSRRAGLGALGHDGLQLPSSTAWSTGWRRTAHTRRRPAEHSQTTGPLTREQGRRAAVDDDANSFGLRSAISWGPARRGSG